MGICLGFFQEPARIPEAAEWVDLASEHSGSYCKLAAMVHQLCGDVENPVVPGDFRMERLCHRLGSG